MVVVQISQKFGDFVFSNFGIEQKMLINNLIRGFAELQNFVSFNLVQLMLNVLRISAETLSGSEHFVVLICACLHL